MIWNGGAPSCEHRSIEDPGICEFCGAVQVEARKLHLSLENGVRYRILEIGRTRHKHIHVKYLRGDAVWYWPITRSGCTYGHQPRILYGPGLKSVVRTS